MCLTRIWLTPDSNILLGILSKEIGRYMKSTQTTSGEDNVELQTFIYLSNIVSADQYASRLFPYLSFHFAFELALNLTISFGVAT